MQLVEPDTLITWKWLPLFILKKSTLFFSARHGTGVYVSDQATQYYPQFWKMWDSKFYGKAWTDRIEVFSRSFGAFLCEDGFVGPLVDPSIDKWIVIFQLYDLSQCTFCSSTLTITATTIIIITGRQIMRDQPSDAYDFPLNNSSQLYQRHQSYNNNNIKRSSVELEQSQNSTQHLFTSPHQRFRHQQQQQQQQSSTPLPTYPRPQ